MHFTMSLVVHLYESEHIFTSAIKDHKDFPYKILPSLPSFSTEIKQIEKCIKITLYPFFHTPNKKPFQNTVACPHLISTERKTVVKTQKTHEQEKIKSQQFQIDENYIYVSS